MFITRRALMQQADGAGGGAGAAGAAGASAAGAAGAADKNGTQQQATQQDAGAGKDAAAGAQKGAQASQGQAQQDASKAGQPNEAPKGDAADKAKAGTQAEIAIKLPDGTKADPKFVEALTTTARKHGLSQEQAQGVAEFLIGAQKESAKAFDAALKQQVAKDTEALKTDPEFGGANFEKTLSARDSALKQLFGEDTAKLFKELGIDTNPGVAKGLARIRALISEDSVGEKGTKVGAGETSREAQLRKMFPNSYDQMVAR